MVDVVVGVFSVMGMIVAVWIFVMRMANNIRVVDVERVFILGMSVMFFLYYIV